MPSVAITPAALTWTPQDAAFQPERVTFGAALLSFSGGAAAYGGAGTLLDAAVPELDRLMPREQLLGPDGTPSVRFMAIWQDFAENIEAAFSALTQQVGDNTTLLAQIQAAQNLAAAANATANEVQERDALAASYLNPTQVVSANSAGTVTVDAHTRIYGDGTSVAVDAGSVTGFAEGAYVTVYYADAAREGGAVDYVGTTNAVAQQGSTHIVGSVQIPLSGQPAATGASPTAPGYIPGGGGSQGYEEVP